MLIKCVGLQAQPLSRGKPSTVLKQKRNIYAYQQLGQVPYESLVFRIFKSNNVLFCYSYQSFMCSLALLSLLKWMFPKSKPVSDVLRRRYGQPNLQGFHKLEQVSQKLAKKQLDLQFLTCCKTYNVFPKFLNFELYRKTLQF